jgi:hypothetical protein
MEGAWQPGLKASWAAIWPQRRFDTNTSNQLLYAGGGSLTQTQTSLTFISPHSQLCRSLYPVEKEPTTHNTKMVS